MVKMLTNIIVVLTILVLESCSALDNMGICKSNITTDTTNDLNKFAKENGGQWCVVRAPNTPLYSSLKALSYELTENGLNRYALKMFYTREGEDGVKNLFTEGDLRIAENGVAKSAGTTIDSQKVQFDLFIFFIKYEPEKYIYYYACSSAGVDKNTDYRFVLAHKVLSKDDIDEIKKMDEASGFKGGELITIGMC